MQAHRLHVMIKMNEKSNRQQTELILKSSPPTSQSEQRWGQRDDDGKGAGREREIETDKKRQKNGCRKSK